MGFLDNVFKEEQLCSYLTLLQVEFLNQSLHVHFDSPT